MVECILLEITQRLPELNNSSIDTIYFGGGTPSLLSYEELMRILDLIANQGNLNPMAEITLEANPDDLKKAQVDALRRTIINRLSIGIQSFDDEDLKRMNRAHLASEADYAIKLAQDNGFENITIDLIYGIPGSSEKQWMKNLDAAMHLNVQHLSAYCMTIEERTAYGKWEREGKIEQVNDESIYNQYKALTSIAFDAGFEHYEVSNFALQGKRSKHNSSYWKGLPYLGIGPSAHSFDGDKTRRWNIANNPIYIKNIHAKNSYWETEKLSRKDLYNERVMTSLRTKEGLNLTETERTFGINPIHIYEREITDYLAKEWLNISNDVISLSEEGMFRADRIASDLFITHDLEE